MEMITDRSLVLMGEKSSVKYNASGNPNQKCR